MLVNKDENKANNISHERTGACFVSCLVYVLLTQCYRWSHNVTSASDKLGHSSLRTAPMQKVRQRKSLLAVFRPRHHTDSGSYAAEARRAVHGKQKGGQ